MTKSMLINVILEEESRVAIVDNGVLDYFEIETLGRERLKGNIYKGVVENVNSSLEAAFVNCGWERPGFLPLDEVNFRVLPAIKGRKGSSKIQEHLAPGMELLVQVIRDKIGNKPPSVTTYYSIPGRYLVLTPHADGSGVSRRIEDEKQRAKLKTLVDDLRPPEKHGVIVRTAGLDQDRRELIRDMGYLLRLWETVERAADAVRPPSLIYRERNLALRTLRDQLTEEVDEVLIDDRAVHESALKFIRAVAPHQERLIRLYEGDKPLFTRFNLEDQIETIYKRRVPLKSGGEIVIETTEAMTAIDVNSSRSRETTAGELALRTNLEAAAEIARQLRLRDIGGLIVVDFIDMEAPKHSRAVEKALAEAMRRDKAKYDATKISKLGILEISRQRLKAAKAAATYVPCVACEGAGTVRTTEAAAFTALRRIQTRIVRRDAPGLKVTLPTEVALYLLNEQRDELVALERRYAVPISLVPRPDFARERFEIEGLVTEGPSAMVPREPSRGGRREGEAREQSAVTRMLSGSPVPAPPGDEMSGRAAIAAAGRPVESREPPSEAQGTVTAPSPRPSKPEPGVTKRRGGKAARAARPEEGERRDRARAFAGRGEERPLEETEGQAAVDVPGSVGSPPPPREDREGAPEPDIEVAGVPVPRPGEQPAAGMPPFEAAAGVVPEGVESPMAAPREPFEQERSIEGTRDDRSGVMPAERVPAPWDEPEIEELSPFEESGEPPASEAAGALHGEDDLPARAHHGEVELSTVTGHIPSEEAEGASDVRESLPHESEIASSGESRSSSAPGGGVRKRRRRRGGRGKRADGEAGSVEERDGGEAPTAERPPGKRPFAEPPHGVVTQHSGTVPDSEGEGRIIWEDDDDDTETSAPAGASRSSAGDQDREAGDEGESAVLSAAAGADEAQKARKRRRRRGGRGRKKHAVPQEGVAGRSGNESERSSAGMVSQRRGPGDESERTSGAVAGRGSRMASSADGDQHERAGAGPGRGGAGQLPPGTKKKRRRHKTHKRDGAHESAAATGTGSPRSTDPGAPRRVPSDARAEARARDATAAPPSSQASADRAAATEKRPAAEDGERREQDEDVPGGWWSRLRGPKKRGSRED